MLRRKLLVSLLLAALALALVPTVLAAVVGGARRPGSDAGAPAIRHAGATRPLFVAPGLAVGARVGSSATVENTGMAAGQFVLTAQADDPQDATDLSVVITRAADGAVLFAGPLAAARSVDVGVLAPGAKTRFRLEVVIGSGQDRATSVTFRWRAKQA